MSVPIRTLADHLLPLHHFSADTSPEPKARFQRHNRSDSVLQHSCVPIARQTIRQTH
jgi:hypothetical protein